MKIAIIADALDTQQAGIHIYVKELLDAMHALEISDEIHIIRVSNERDYPKWTEHCVPIKSIPLHMRWRQLTTIPNILNKLHPDIVYETAHFGPFRLNRSIKRCTMIHDLTPLLFPEYHSVSSHIAHKLLLRGIVDKADAIIVNSKQTQADLALWDPISVSKSWVIPLAPRSKVLNKIQKPIIDGSYILTVGTIEPRKNHLLLLEAFEGLQISNLKLVIAGAIGWKSKKIVSRIKNSPKYDSIQLLGRVTNETLSNLYQNAAIMVYPSHYEGFGLPVLEGMQYGIPVLCSDASSLPEVGGKAARYFPIDDAESLTTLINNVMDNEQLSSELKAASKSHAQEFSWKKVALQTLEILRNVQ